MMSIRVMTYHIKHEGLKVYESAWEIIRLWPVIIGKDNELWLEMVNQNRCYFGGSLISNVTESPVKIVLRIIEGIWTIDRAIRLWK